MRLSVRLVGLIGLVVLACKTGVIPDSDSIALETIAQEKLGEEVTSTVNQTEEYILFVQKINPTSLQPVRFIVLEIKTQQVVLQKEFKPGYVKWSGDYQIEWLDQPGMIKPEETLSSYVQFAIVRTQLN